MSRSLLLACALLVCAGTDLVAQAQPVDLVPGRRIRVHRQTQSTLIGALLSVSSDTLTMITTGPDTVAVARSTIRRVDVAVGTKSQAGKGAVTGLLIGGLGGALLGVASSGSDDGDFLDAGPAEWAVSGAVFFGAIGAGVGALIGSGHRTDRWEAVVVPTVTVIPVPGKPSQVAVGVKLRF